MNEPGKRFSLDSRECSLLREEFGDKNVEGALVFVTEACDPRGMRVVIRPTYEMVRDALEAVHGRLGVGWVRMKGDRPFYHHPDNAWHPPAEVRKAI